MSTINPRSYAIGRLDLLMPTDSAEEIVDILIEFMTETEETVVALAAHRALERILEA